MTFPPQKLVITLLPGICYVLNSEHGQTLGMIDYAVALHRAVNGEIEGVCAASGRIRYLRELPAHTRQAIQDTASEDVYERSKPQPLNAVTNLGAYRQHLDVGSVWSLALCKRIDGARA